MECSPGGIAFTSSLIRIPGAASVSVAVPMLCPFAFFSSITTGFPAGRAVNAGPTAASSNPAPVKMSEFRMVLLAVRTFANQPILGGAFAPAQRKIVQIVLNVSIYATSRRLPEFAFQEIKVRASGELILKIQSSKHLLQPLQFWPVVEQDVRNVRVQLHVVLMVVFRGVEGRERSQLRYNRPLIHSGGIDLCHIRLRNSLLFRRFVENRRAILCPNVRSLPVLLRRIMHH